MQNGRNLSKCYSPPRRTNPKGRDMRIVSFESIDETRDPCPVIQHKVALEQGDCDGYETDFEQFVLDGLKNITGPENQAFVLTAGIITKRPSRDDFWRPGWGEGFDAKKGQPTLGDVVLFWVNYPREHDEKQFLVACVGLSHIYEGVYKNLVEQYKDTPKEHRHIVVIECARFFRHQIAVGANRLQGETARVASDLLLQHQSSLANYERLGAFVKEYYIV